MTSVIPSVTDVDPFFFGDRTGRDQAPAGFGPERPAPPAPHSPVRRRRRQWGGDRRTQALPMVPQPVSDRRVAMARLAIIVTVTAWLGYLITWFFEDFFHPGYENAVDRAESVLYLLIVTLLTVSALAYLLSRLGFFYRTRTHHRASRAILDQFYDTTTPDADHDHPVLPGGRAGHPQHAAVRRAAGVPGQARGPAHRRPVRAQDRQGARAARGRAGAAGRDRAAAGRAGQPVHPRAAAVRGVLRAPGAARARLDDRAGQLLRRGGRLARAAGRRLGDHRPHRRLLRQRGASCGWRPRSARSARRCSTRPTRAWCSSSRCSAACTAGWCGRSAPRSPASSASGTCRCRTSPTRP